MRQTAEPRTNQSGEALFKPCLVKLDRHRPAPGTRLVGHSTSSVTGKVKANSAPVVAQALPPQMVALGAISEPLDLAEYFGVPDGDLLTMRPSRTVPRW